MYIHVFDHNRHKVNCLIMDTDVSIWAKAPTSAQTLMTHSLNKEASKLLCDAMRHRLEDGDASASPSGTAQWMK